MTFQSSYVCATIAACEVADVRAKHDEPHKGALVVATFATALCVCIAHESVKDLSHISYPGVYANASGCHGVSWRDGLATAWPAFTEEVVCSSSDEILPILISI